MKYVETDLMKGIIINHIIGERKATKKERGKYFYASEGYLPHNPRDSTCARQLGYKILGYEPDEERDDMYPIFAIGELYHEFIQKIFVKEKLATVVEEFTIMYDDDGKYYWIRQDKNKVIIKEPVEIHGRLDLKFRLEKEKGFIADIKTVNEKSWFYLDKPKEAHYSQLQLYLHDSNLSQGFILYINKSTGEMKEFMIEEDKEYTERLLKDYEELHKTITTKGLPERHFQSGHEVPWQCKYCGFTKSCLGMSLEQVQKRRFITYPKDEGEPKEPSSAELAEKMIEHELV